MREIKFRAWITRYDEPFMLYLKPNMTWRHVENGLVLAFTEDGEDYGYAEVYSEEIDYPIMQYTGLKDKNGKEIYEGDILGMGHGIVIWSEKSTAFFVEGKDFKHTVNFMSGHEILGNIYENSELLT